MTIEVMWTIALAVAGGLAFIAYHHPRQFQCLFWISVAFLSLLVPLGWITQRIEANTVARIKALDLPTDQFEKIVWALKTSPAISEETDLALKFLFYGAYYVLALGLLPSIGLTAGEKRPSIVR